MEVITMNKVIHKSFFKRGTAILLALVCLISAICLVPINAASREVTITFDYAYDTGGNIIGFVQYTEHDGYVIRLRFQKDRRCICFDFRQ